MITSQLVAGIQSGKVRVLREGSELSLDKAVDICRSREVTQQQMKLFHGECEVDNVNKRRTDNKRACQSSTASGKVFRNKQDKDGETERPNGLACRNCGRKHEARKCPAYGKECYKCQKKIHFAKMCRSESKQRQVPNKRVREIAADSNDDFVIDAVYCVENKLGKEKEALAVVNILSNKVRVKLDMAAEVNVMPYRVHKLKQELDRMQKEQVIVKVDEPTDWVHNPVIVEKPNGKLRAQQISKERTASITNVGRNFKQIVWCEILQHFRC